MTLLDAYALIAFLVGGPARSQVRAVFREGNVAIATANLVEVLDVSARLHGLPIPRAMEAIDPLLEESLEPIPLDAARAQRAAAIRADHYHRLDCPISLGDSVLLASAGAGDRIATPDPDVLSVAATEGVETLLLPGQG